MQHGRRDHLREEKWSVPPWAEPLECLLPLSLSLPSDNLSSAADDRPGRSGTGTGRSHGEGDRALCDRRRCGRRDPLRDLQVILAEGTGGEPASRLAPAVSFPTRWPCQCPTPPSAR